MPAPISLILTDHNGNSLQVTGATILTPAERQALGILLSQPLSAVLCDVNGNPLQLSSSGSSGAWASLTGDLTETQVIPFDGPSVGTPDSGISRIGVDSLAIGDGTTGDTSGTLTLSSLYASLLDSVAITLTGAFTDGTGSVGTSGQVLSSTVSGTKWVSASSGFTNPMTTLGDTIYENATPAAARLAGNTSATKQFLTQTGTGSASAAPAWGTIATSDLPTSGTWAFAGTLSGGLTITGNSLQTSTDTLGLASYTAAISNSPSMVIAGSYQSATSTFAEDSWTIQDVIGTGTNGTSTLTFTHSGSSGAASVSVPSLTCGAFNIASGNITFANAGTIYFEFHGAIFGGGSGTAIGFSSNTNPTAATPDTAISRVSAGILGIGTGASGNTAGTLGLTTLQFTASASAPTSAGTAGTVGQIIANGGNLYLCSVTGVAGSATWNKLSMASV